MLVTNRKHLNCGGNIASKNNARRNIANSTQFVKNQHLFADNKKINYKCLRRIFDANCTHCVQNLTTTTTKLFITSIL